MNHIPSSSIGRYKGILWILGGIATYILVAGSTGFCPLCSSVTRALGISSAVAIEPVPMADDEKPAPAWKLKDVDGKEISSETFKGKVVILDFWATWCPPCVMEIPGFIEIQKEYGSKGLQMVGISLDQSPEPVKKFMAEKGVNYQIVMGNQEVATAYGGIEGIPTTFIINRKGNIVWSHMGYGTKEMFEQELKKYL